MDFPAADREFEFTQADFERIRALIQQHAGIALAPVKQDMVYSRLARRLRALGLRRFDEYLQRLQRGDQLEWEAFVNSLTTNLTSFFREAHHFDILARQLKASTQRPFRVWCAASSTGEEAYSLAMTACETFTSLAPPIQIIASDIDTSVLATARAAVYSRDRLDRITEERMRSYFVADPTSGRENYKVRIELQRLITFTRINLLETHWPLQGPLDAIFCRNVMIYFDKPTQYSVLKRFKPLLRSGGLLYAGHSESFLHAADLFKSIGRTVYAPADPGQPEFRVG